jgi:pilus assembly protein Flp/PilA
MNGPSNAHGGAATPRSSGGVITVALIAAESQKKFNARFDASLVSCRPKPVASTLDVRVSKGGVTTMSFFDLLQFARMNWKKEEGQTMAEYGVVLAVIAVIVFVALGLLQGGITKTLNSVTALL